MASEEAKVINITEDGGITKKITKEGEGDVCPAGYEVTCQCFEWRALAPNARDTLVNFNSQVTTTELWLATAINSTLLATAENRSR